MTLQKIDNLILCRGRLGTITLARALELHPLIDYKYCTAENFASLPNEFMNRDRDDRKNCVIYHHEVLPDNLLNGLANATRRELLIQLVRDPISHIISNYNHLLFLHCVAMLHGDEENALKYQNYPPLFDCIRNDISKYKYYGFAKKFGNFDRWKVIDTSDLDQTKINDTFRDLFESIGVPSEPGIDFWSMPEWNYIRNLMLRDEMSGQPIVSLDLGDHQIACHLCYLEDSEIERGLQRNGNVLAISPGIAEKIKFPMRNSTIALRTELTILEALPLEYQAQLLDRSFMDKYFRDSILPWWMELTNTVYDFWVAKRVERLDADFECWVRGELKDDVAAMQAEFPRLKELWDF